jgi:hypothetical protein
MQDCEVCSVLLLVLQLVIPFREVLSQYNKTNMIYSPLKHSVLVLGSPRKKQGGILPHPASLLALVITIMILLNMDDINYAHM